mgnify:CR=1 FL=1
MKRKGLGLIALSAAMLAGCATGGRNYQTDIDGLNARVNALQGQLAAKDQELGQLQNEVSDQRMAREAAEAALGKAKSDLAALQDRPTTSAPSKKAYASDLK